MTTIEQFVIFRYNFTIHRKNLALKATMPWNCRKIRISLFVNGVCLKEKHRENNRQLGGGRDVRSRLKSAWLSRIENLREFFVRRATSGRAEDYGGGKDLRHRRYSGVELHQWLFLSGGSVTVVHQRHSGKFNFSVKASWLSTLNFSVSLGLNLFSSILCHV